VGALEGLGERGPSDVGCSRAELWPLNNTRGIKRQKWFDHLESMLQKYVSAIKPAPRPELSKRRFDEYLLLPL
jgi:hypothetical protein